MPELPKNGKQLELHPMGKEHFSPQKRIDLLTAYAQSGLSIKKYAAVNGIGYSTIQRWLRDYKTACGPYTLLLSNASSTDVHNEHVACNAPCDNVPPSPVDFMDITAHLTHTTTSTTKGNANDADSSEYSDAPPTISISCGNHDGSMKAPEHQTASTLCHHLDVVLLNGIRITLHQTPFDASVMLIKSLV